MTDPPDPPGAARESGSFPLPPRTRITAPPLPPRTRIIAPPLPPRARVVIIGGGVIGTSVAYHLAQLGWTDVLLVEQGQLSCGTTWHAAGLVGQLRASENGTRLVQYSTELYARLEAETGLSTGFRRCGGVTVARTADRLTQLRRTAATAEAYQLECELISPRRAGELYPVMRTDDLAGAIWLPGDGRANPADLTAALARGARDRGVTIRERTRVTARPGRRRRGHRSAHRRRRRRGRGGGQLRRPVGQAGRRDVRGDRPAALGRALLRGDRADRRGAPGPARAARPGRLYLSQGRGGRPGRRRLRARGQALGRARPAALPVRVPAAGGGLGPLRDPDGQRDHPDPGAGQDRDQDVLQRPGELHPGQPVHPGRGAGAAELLRRRRVQLGRHRVRGRRRAGPGRVDRRRRAEPGSVRGRHPALRRLQRQQPVAARPGQRGPGPALRGAVAEPRADQRPAVPPFPGLSPARAGRCLLRQQDGLGAGQLLRPAGRPPGHRVRLGPAELAALVLGRAAGRPHRRRRVRPDQLLEVPGHRPGRRAGPAVAVHRRRRRRARPDRLHRPAQRAAAPTRPTSPSPG